MDNSNLDRRTHERYLAPSFSLLLKSTQYNANHLSENISLLTVDFNRFGMAIESQHNFKIGDELQLVISDGINHSVEVSCFVCNRAKIKNSYRCGLHFIEQNNNKGKIKETLISLEEQLEEA
ncbi:MAG: hypothetical protein ACI9T9_000334 [Oleiphilaceae bacterium]|jgi:hypothetical protein